MKHIFVLNPTAGDGKRVEKLKAEIESVCTKENADFEVYTTKKRYDAERYVKEICASAKDKVRFYACGGDGTLNEIANGAVNYDIAELGLIPIGTGNDFVKNFTDTENFFDIKKQLDGTAAPIDMIKYNDRYGINMINIGFDCDVAEKVGELKNNKLIPVKLAYVAGVVKTLFKKFGTNMKIYIDGEKPIDREMLLIAISNGRFCGGGFKSSPLADLDDGIIDLCIVEKVTRGTFLSLVGSYKKGTHLEAKGADKIITYKKCGKFEMRFDGEQSICIDGEIEKIKGAVFEAVRNAIKFSIPYGSKMITAIKERKEKVLV